MGLGARRRAGGSAPRERDAPNPGWRGAAGRAPKALGTGGAPPPQRPTCLLSARGLRAPGVGARPAAAGLGLQAGTARERTKAPGLGARRPSARAASYQRSGGGARKLAGGDGGLRPTAGPRSPVGLGRSR